MTFRGTDRRFRARYKVRLPFVLRDNGQEIRGFTRNISLLGVSAYGDSSVSQVQSVQCLLNIPEKANPLVANGTVIRCEQLSQPHPDGAYEIGVFFKEFQGKDEAELSGFLTHLQEEERSAIQAGYRALKQRLAAKRRRRRLELLRRRKRRQLRLRRRREALRRKKKSRPRGRPRIRRPRRARSRSQRRARPSA